MAANVSHKLRNGIKPQAFIDGMTKNQDTFLSRKAEFTWPSEEDRAFFASLSNRDDLRCLIIAADWCGDVVRNIPVVLEALKETEIPTEIFIMEEHLDLMDEFLTMGGRSIPVVLFADTGGHVLAKWGPRPKHVQDVMIAFKEQNPDRNAPEYEENLKAARAEMLKQYGEGTGYQAVIVKELRELLSSI